MLKIKSAVRSCQRVGFGDIQPQQAHAQVEARVIGEWIELHLIFEVSLVHRQRRGGDRCNQRRGFVAEVAQILDRSIKLAEINIDRWITMEGPEVDRSIADHRAVDLEWKQVANDLQPRPASTGLTL